MNEKDAARALVRILGESRWQAVALAKAFVALTEGASAQSVARELFNAGAFSLKRANEIVAELPTLGFIAFLEPRKKLGSAENPITKMFPAAITEQRFIAKLDLLRERRGALAYQDERESGHTLVDFRLQEGESVVPINVKNAGTRFESAQQLVGIAPDNCLPIPAYKAFDAVEKESNLIYAVAIDYQLLGIIREKLIPLFTEEEQVAWKLLNAQAGAHVKDAEDRFVYGMTARHWETLSPLVRDVPFHLISARKSIRILQTKPQRTPGLGLRAWGTGASAEVNVHISVAEETKLWSEVADRIALNGLVDIVGAVNRKRTEVVYDPEI